MQGMTLCYASHHRASGCGTQGHVKVWCRSRVPEQRGQRWLCHSTVLAIFPHMLLSLRCLVTDKTNTDTHTCE